MSLFPELDGNDFINKTLQNMGLGGSPTDAASNILSKNLTYLINKNINPPANNSPSPIYAVPATSTPSSDFSGIVSGYGKWILGGGALIGLYFILRRK